MTGRLVLPGSAPEAEWLEARRHGITASEIAIVMGLSPYSSPFALFHRKTGALPAEGDKAVFERGHVLEPYIARKFAERRPEFWAGGNGQALYAHPDRPWQMATPDRVLSKHVLFVDDDAIVHEGPPVAVLECKTDAGEDAWGDEGTDEIPVHYRAQVLWQMDVMGVGTGYVACLLMRQWKIRVYEIGHGPGPCAQPLTVNGVTRLLPPGSGGCPACADLRVMRVQANRFLERIDLGNPPEVDWRPATGDALRRLHPAVIDKDIPIGAALRIQYQAAVRRYGEAKQRKALLTNRVLDAIGDGRRAVAAGPGAAVIAVRSASEPRRIDGAQLRAEYPAAAAACTHTAGHPEIKLTPAKPKETKP